MSNLGYFIAITLFVSCNCRPKAQKNSDLETNTGSKKALSIDKLQPPDHLEAVHFERDGMLNKDFHKTPYKEIDDEPSEIADSKLKDIFNK